MSEANATPKVNITFLYLMCNDVDPMRAFYGELLGMQEKSYMKQDGFGWLNYVCEGFELMFFHYDTPLPVQAGWAWQPGGFDLPEGEEPTPAASFSVEIPESSYAETVARLRAADAPTQTTSPMWRQDSYWGYTVKDPMGHTIEVFSKVKDRPEGDPPEWPQG